MTSTKKPKWLTDGGDGKSSGSAGASSGKKDDSSVGSGRGSGKPDRIAFLIAKTRTANGAYGKNRRTDGSV